MPKIVVASDSFKGTLSSKEICTIAKNTINKILPSYEVITFPIADGGEGTVDFFIESLSFKKVPIKIKDAYFKELSAYYAIKDKVAVMEISTLSSLYKNKLSSNNPAIASSYGLGEMINDAIENKHVKEIIIGLGGSVSNDAGCGCACALGAKFYNINNQEFIPLGQNLTEIKDIDLSTIKEKLANIKVTCICDVINPMHGINGAAYVFAKQKGADNNMIKMLDDNLCYLDKFILNKYGYNYANRKRTGAAGAFGYGALVFLKASLKNGIDTILKYLNFEKHLKNCDFVITGEGKLDNQSLKGKVISGIINACHKCNTKIVLICGQGEKSVIENLKKDSSIIGIFQTLNNQNYSWNEIKENAKNDYIKSLTNILLFLK